MEWLPDDAVQRIHHFLPIKDAAQTAILCKSWKRAWDSRSSVDLRTRRHHRSATDFKEFLTSSLRRYAAQGFAAESLKTDSFCKQFFPGIARATEDWLRFTAATCKLKVLEVYSDQHEIPNGLVSCSTLITLRLFGSWNPADPSITTAPTNHMAVDFPSLKHLALDGVRMDAAAVSSFVVRGCPALETLSIVRCDCTELWVSGLEIAGLDRIAGVTVEHCSGLKRVHVRASTLRDFCCRSAAQVHPCSISLGGCELGLRRLVVESGGDKLLTLETPISSFTRLDILELVNVTTCCEIVLGPNLSCLRLVNLETPLSWSPNSMGLSRLELECHIHKDNCFAWLHNLKELLVKAKHLRGLRMGIKRQDSISVELLVHEDFSYLALRNILHHLCKSGSSQGLQVLISSSMVSSEEWINCLFERSLNGFSGTSFCIALASPSSSDNNFVEGFRKKLCNWNTAGRRKRRRASKNERLTWVEEEDSIGDTGLLSQALSTYRLARFALMKVNVDKVLLEV